MLPPAHKASNAATDTLDLGGSPNNSSSFQNRQREAQDAFLKAYSKTGTTRAAIAVAKIGRTTVYDWDKGDVQGFKARWEDARHTFREALEEDMYELLQNPQGNRGSDVLRMFALKAVWPDKYRDTVIVTDDTAKDLLAKLRGKGKRDSKVDGQSDA